MLKSYIGACVTITCWRCFSNVTSCVGDVRLEAVTNTVGVNLDIRKNIRRGDHDRKKSSRLANVCNR